MKSLAFALALLASPALAQSSFTLTTTAGQDAGIAWAMKQPGACGSTTNADGSVTLPASAQIYVSCVLQAAMIGYVAQSQAASLSSAVTAAKAGNPAALQAQATALAASAAVVVPPAKTGQ